MAKVTAALLLALSLALTGCAEWQAVVGGADSAAVTITKNAAQDALTVNQQIFCLTPYFEVVNASKTNPALGSAFILSCGSITVSGVSVPSNSVNIQVPAPVTTPAPAK